MIGMTDRPAIAGIFAAFTATGSKPPKAVAAAHAYLKTTVERYGAGPMVDAEALPLAVIAALDAGTDPATSPEVQAVLARHTLAGRHTLATDLASLLIDQLRDACRDQADAIIEAWRPSFTEAATDLVAAHTDLGGLDLADTATVVRRGPAATASWSAAQRAVDTIAAVATGWAHLVTFTTGTLPNRRYRLAHIAEVAPTRWLDLDLGGASADPWAALGHGLTLRLPTIDEHRATVGAIEAELGNRAEAAETAERDALSGRRSRVG